MTGADLKQKRAVAGIPGRLLCARAKMHRSRLSHIERGYVRGSEEELVRIERVLNDLIQKKQKLVEMATEVGWPVEAL